MAGYLIAQIEVTDPERYREYTALAPATIEQYGGEFLVRGGAHEVVEGSWPDTRTVILRFSSVERAREWYDSPEYAGPKAIRQQASNSSFVIIEGT